MNLPPRLQVWATYFQEAGEKYGLDPCLIAAICDRESGGGIHLKPPMPEGTGDGGNGLGLMQVDKRYHPEFYASGFWKEPRENIMYAAEFLSLLIRHFASSLPEEKADISALQCGVAAYNCGLGGVYRAINPHMKETDISKYIDGKTTGANYSADVLHRMQEFKLTAQKEKA